MTIQYQLTFEDYKEAWQLYLKKRGNSRPRLIATAIITALGCLYFMFQSGTFLEGVFVGLFGMAAFLFIFVIFFQAKNIEAFWKANAFLAKPLLLITSPQSILLQNTDSRSEFTWQAFTRWQETPNLFLLHLSEQTFHIVPKRAFADETQINEFRSLLKNIDAAQAAQQPPLPAP